MSTIKYEGDERTYRRFKNRGDPHFYVTCAETSTDKDGNIRSCSWTKEKTDTGLALKTVSDINVALL